MYNSRTISKLEFIDVPLTKIGSSAFYYFKGSLTIKPLAGSLPDLYVDTQAFHYAADSGSLVDTCGAKFIYRDAFVGYVVTTMQVCSEAMVRCRRIDILVILLHAYADIDIATC
jgi:hypothetical protein